MIKIKNEIEKLWEDQKDILKAKDDGIKKAYKEFNEYYSIDALEKIDGDERVKRLFGAVDTTGLFAWLENYSTALADVFPGPKGQIGIKFIQDLNSYCLYKPKNPDDKSASPKIQKMNNEKAKEWADEVFSALKKCCEIIEDKQLNDAQDYKYLYKELIEALADFKRPDVVKRDNWYWTSDGKVEGSHINSFFRKYFHCMFRDKFTTIYARGELEHKLKIVCPEEAEELKNDSFSDFLAAGVLALCAKQIGAENPKFTDMLFEKYGTKDNNSNNSPDGKSLIIETSVEELLSQAIETDKQIVFTGPPGTGKTFSIRKWMEENAKDRWAFVQFHPSYDYTDFVEGLRPAHLADTEKGEEDAVTFVRIDGTFKAFCRQIVEAKDEKDYYFVIDEINRADLSKVFGELMFALEEDYRGVNHKIPTQYNNLTTYEFDAEGKAKPIEDDCFGEGFFIPENLYIIGTMNDIDRSVESFDFALRRRFKWIEISAKSVMRATLKDMGVDESDLKCDEEGKPEKGTLLGRINDMNEYIADGEYSKKFGLSDAFCIGPSYFKSYKSGDSIDDIWKSKIEPILREYCRGHAEGDINSFLSKCESKLKNISSGSEQ